MKENKKTFIGQIFQCLRYGLIVTPQGGSEGDLLTSLIHITTCSQLYPTALLLTRSERFVFSLLSANVAEMLNG